MSEKYSLVGVDGNAFYIMDYVKKAMEKEKFPKAEINEMLAEAQSSDYDNLIAVCLRWINKCNERK